LAFVILFLHVTADDFPHLFFPEGGLLGGARSAVPPFGRRLRRLHRLQGAQQLLVLLFQALDASA
jgi:hypothetical protein